MALWSEHPLQHAILGVDPGEVVTASRAEPEIYQVGAYTAWLRRISPIAHQFGGPADEAAQASQQTQAGPSYVA